MRQREVDAAGGLVVEHDHVVAAPVDAVDDAAYLQLLAAEIDLDRRGRVVEPERALQCVRFEAAAAHALDERHDQKHASAAQFLDRAAQLGDLGQPSMLLFCKRVVHALLRPRHDRLAPPRVVVGRTEIAFEHVVDDRTRLVRLHLRLVAPAHAEHIVHIVLERTVKIFFEPTDARVSAVPRLRARRGDIETALDLSRGQHPVDLVLALALAGDRIQCVVCACRVARAARIDPRLVEQQLSQRRALVGKHIRVFRRTRRRALRRVDRQREHLGELPYQRGRRVRLAVPAVLRIGHGEPLGRFEHEHQRVEPLGVVLRRGVRLDVKPRPAPLAALLGREDPALAVLGRQFARKGSDDIHVFDVVVPALARLADKDAVRRQRDHRDALARGGARQDVVVFEKGHLAAAHQPHALVDQSLELFYALFETGKLRRIVERGKFCGICIRFCVKIARFHELVDLPCELAHLARPVRERRKICRRLCAHSLGGRVVGVALSADGKRLGRRKTVDAVSDHEILEDVDVAAVKPQNAATAKLDDLAPAEPLGDSPHRGQHEPRRRLRGQLALAVGKTRYPAAREHARYHR